MRDPPQRRPGTIDFGGIGHRDHRPVDRLVPPGLQEPVDDLRRCRPVVRRALETDADLHTSVGHESLVPDHHVVDRQQCDEQPVRARLEEDCVDRHAPQIIDEGHV
ncbi:hypothetical protein P9139_11725 [Curtobacterium flaccumfaciens]|nr:hypothetical protein P9139_11725 [Curtobacterium flaccumfaciens]